MSKLICVLSTKLYAYPLWPYADAASIWWRSTSRRKLNGAKRYDHRPARPIYPHSNNWASMGEQFQSTKENKEATSFLPRHGPPLQ